MTTLHFPSILGILSFIVLLVSYNATVEVARKLSPQGCRMSWMSPSYILQASFDKSWTPLATRYSLWLYREDGWEPHDPASGLPVLFIPGNAGSSRQVRSIASSAAKQYYSSPFVPDPDFSQRGLKPLSIYTVDFNEDLSAFHGTTLKAQIDYASHAITYILSRYPPNTKIIILGHSMGGVVATALLPSENISAIITMSTPHTLPPARFDSRVQRLYDQNRKTLEHDATPILSICGGATDMMIPSESCILPPPTPQDPTIYRRTIFSAALEGSWTGVGHREMVWCHQVRWRVAKAALELASYEGSNTSQVLDEWLRGGEELLPLSPTTVPTTELLTNLSASETLPPGQRLTLAKPVDGMYLLPLKDHHDDAQFTLLVSQGSVLDISPQHSRSLQVSVFICSSSSPTSAPRCTPLKPTTLKLIPNPVAGSLFPVPSEGSDESEGVVFFQAGLPQSLVEEEPRWIGVRVRHANSKGWVVAQIHPRIVFSNSVGMLGSSLGHADVQISDQWDLSATVSFPNLISNALVVYRVRPIPSGHSCDTPLLPPLIMHTSHSSETHYFPVFGHIDNQILLHTHLPAPYIRSALRDERGVQFTMLSTSPRTCHDLSGLRVEIDWPSTLGRWATRYPTTLVTWAVGVVSLIMFYAWQISERYDAPLMSITEASPLFCRQVLPKLIVASFFVALLPLSRRYYLGTAGSLIFAPIAPILMTVAFGLVFISWTVLRILMWPLWIVSRMISSPVRRPEDGSVRRGTLVSMLLIFVIVSLVVPWQAAYTGCWLIHLYTCASNRDVDNFRGDRQIDHRSPSPNTSRSPGSQEIIRNNLRHNEYLLLLMTWLLPLAAPIIAVWVRTLITTGFTTPFDGDHFFLSVAPFLILVDFASWTTKPILEMQRFERVVSLRWLFLVLAAVAFFIGPQHAYSVFDAARAIIGVIVVVRIGRRYWGGSPWS